MTSIADSTTPALRLRLALAGLALVATLVALPAVAFAEVPLPGGRSEASLAINGESARLVGSSALVPVKCLGSQNGICSGTLTLAIDGHKHRAPFSLVGGAAQTIPVPVGSAGGRVGASAVAVARTLQPSGGARRATGVLHLR